MRPPAVNGGSACGEGIAQRAVGRKWGRGISKGLHKSCIKLMHISFAYFRCSSLCLSKGSERCEKYDIKEI